MDNSQIQCRVCNTIHKDTTVLHKHIKSHKILLAEYYQKYYPKYDLYDNTIIRFRNLEQYLRSDFNSRSNLCRWLNSLEKEKAQKYCVNVFRERALEKRTNVAPCQVELRSHSRLPGIHFFENALGGYVHFCDSLQLRQRFKNLRLKNAKNELSRHSIIVDTREQNPLEVQGRTQEKALKYGDYAAVDSEKTCKCVIERKGVSDFYGTLSGGLERFKREIQRAKDDKAYLVVLVEADVEEVRQFPYHHSVRYKKLPNADYIFHNMRDLIHEFDCIQFLFVKNREEASRVLKIVLSHGCECRDVDLQYAYDIKDI